jgi:uncharacterized protein YcnI
MNGKIVWLLLWWLVGGGIAGAHIDIAPRETIPNRWETFVLNVPTETDSPTVEVRLVVPPGFEVEAVGHRADWRIALRRDERGVVREVVWSGGQIPPLTFEELKLLVKAAPTPGTYDWQARQRYADGQESLWSMRTVVRSDGGGSSQQADEALKTAQTALTVSFLAMGVATVLIVVTLIVSWQSANRKGRSDA